MKGGEITKNLLFIIILAAMLSGCAAQGGNPSPSSASASDSLSEDAFSSLEDPAASMGGSFSETAEEGPLIEDTGGHSEIHPYLNGLVSRVVDGISTSEMSEYERAKAAFDYMIEHTVLDEPIGLDLWRVHGGGSGPIPFVEQRALSPLRFGVGMCEDYAAALTLLLRGMGLEARYVPGLTYSLEGHLVDHAWTMVHIDGAWYHLDSQLEDNISRHGAVRYRYFLKGDGQMAGSHLWGQRLIDSGLLTTEQNAEIAEHYLFPDCPQDYPTPERHMFTEAALPDLEMLRAQAQAEVTAYEDEYGMLPPMELNTAPPVFGLEGFGPPDEG